MNEPKATMQPVKQPNLKLLQTFLLVADHLSFKRAAELSNRSQSAVSVQVRALEAQLGVTLFLRTTRNVKLTREGENLARSVRRAMFEIDVSIKNIKDVINTKARTVSIACSPTIVSSILPKVLSAHEKLFTDVRIDVWEATTDRIFEVIREKKVDFVVGQLAKTEEFKSEFVANDPLYAVAHKSFFEGKEDEIRLEELSSYPLLLLDAGNPLRVLFEVEMDLGNLPINARYQFNQAPALLSLAVAGLGVAILPKIVLPETPVPEIQVLRISPGLQRPIGIMMHHHQRLSRVADDLAGLMREAITAKLGTAAQRSAMMSAGSNAHSSL